MATNVIVRMNTTVNTGAGQDFVTVPANFVDMDLVNDRLIYSTGSASVADGQASPNAAQLNEAATIIGIVDVEIPKTFLDDFSDSPTNLKEIFGSGSGDDQFVYLASFDNATASEPSLEAFDDNTHTTANNQVLGAGTPSSSMISVILTTGSTPGASWVGTKIAGASNVLLLNGGGGALSGATDVYWNTKIVIPASFPTPAAETPILTIRFTFN